MRFSLAITAGALLSLCQAYEVNLGHKNATEVNVPSKGFIIELESGAGFGRRSLVDSHAEFHKRAREVLGDYTVLHEFKNSELFYGLSVDAPKGTNIQAFRNLPGVKNVWKNVIIQRPSPIGFETAAAKNATVSKRAPVAARAGPASVAHVTGNSNVNAPLLMTGADQLHQLGIKGKGVKIGIVDSGIDYTHPALGGGFGEGFKVAGGHDFVGDNYNAHDSNPPIADADPMVGCLSGGHGTHVAGIIAGQDPEGVGFGFTGVAPEATLYMYRVFGCWGDTTFAIIMQAIEAAYTDGVDIISLSLGSIEFFETADPMLASLKAKGVSLVIAAGNDGDRGPYHPSYPSVDVSVVGVGSVNNIVFPALYLGNANDGSEIEYGRVIPMDVGPFHVFKADDGADTWCNETYWNDALASFPDPSLVIALVSPGSLCAAELQDRVPGMGFSHAWVVTDDVSDIILPPGGWFAYDHSIIREREFKKIQAGLALNGKNYTISFDDPTVHGGGQPTGGTMNDFSSIGPTVEMSLKPQLSAPGGNILSTWPTVDGIGYSMDSGTSMATPHIAGCFALLKGAFPHLTPDEILHLLQSTASPVYEPAIPGLLTSPAQQGAGMVNVYKAYKAETVLSTTELILKDSSTPAPQTVTIENRSSGPKTYKISHKGASLINATPRIYQDNWQNDKFVWDKNESPTYASASFSSDSITVQAGASASFVVTVVAPEADPELLPIYGGYISIADDVTDYVIPYIGVPYSRGDRDTIDFSNVINKDMSRYLPTPPKGVPQIPLIFNYVTDERNNDLMEFDLDLVVDINLLALVVVIRQPSAYLRVDVVSPHQRVHPNGYGFDRCHRFDTHDPTNLMEPVDTFLGLPTYGEIYSVVAGTDKPTSGVQDYWENYWSPYGPLWIIWWKPEVSAPNGTLFNLPNADYRFVVRALKSGHNWDDVDGYSSWLSPIVRLNYTAPA